MPDDGSKEYAQRIVITALPTLASLPTITARWGGRITGLPSVASLPRVSP